MGINNMDLRCVKIAFDAYRKISAQSLAFDFVKDFGNLPLIVEISYNYNANSVYQCSGHFDEELNRHEGQIWPEDAIIQDVIEHINIKQGS